MHAFPAEFSAFLKTKVWSSRSDVAPIARGSLSKIDRDRLRWFPLAVKPVAVAPALRLLERTMAPLLRPMRTPVDPALISGMKRNYTDALTKVLRNSSVSLNEPRSKATAAARSIGLLPMLSSPSLAAFAATLSGLPLLPDPALQLIRYRAGDYVGPHNDHHPEHANLREGYVDLQITLTSRGVARQYLLYEAGSGDFNRVNNIGIASGVSVSLLPFWHQVTPLEAKPGHEKDAIRWLLLVSFEIDYKKAKISARSR